MIFYPKNTKFALEVTTYNERLRSKLEVNHASYLWVMSDQSLVFFLSVCEKEIIILDERHIQLQVTSDTCNYTNAQKKVQSMGMAGKE